MPASRQSQEALLRTVYQKWLRRSFNVDSTLSYALRRNEKNYAEGKEISIPLHTAGGSTYQWTDNNELPPADNQQVARATFNYKMLTNRIQVQGDFKDAAKGGSASEAKPMNFEMRSLLADIKHGLNFDMFGDGSGLQATCAGATSATALTVDSVNGLRNNMRVDIIKKADGSLGGGARGVRINISIDSLAVTLQDTGALNDFNEVNSNASDYGIYRQNSRNKAIFGLEAIISDSNPSSANYGGIDRTAAGTDYWKGVVHDNSGGGNRALTDTLMQNLVDDIETRSDGKTKLIITTHSLWSTIASGRAELKRYNGNHQRSDGWFQALDWAGIPIVRDKHCPANKMFFIDTDSMWIYQDSEGQWMDEDGAILARVSGYVAYEAAWYRRMQIVCPCPNAQGVLAEVQ